MKEFSIKVACIGNMNNNYFSLMRYLRGLGLDAYLLMYTNEHDLFLPENDTWEIEKWQPYIKTLNLTNNIWEWLKVTPGKIKDELQPGRYDIYIGCGLSPAYFTKAKLKLDIFTPYSYGIEFIDDAKFNLKHPRSSIYKFHGRRCQERGIKNARKVLTLQKHFFQDYNNVFKRLKREIIPLSLPMVYNLEETGHLVPDDDLRKHINIFQQKDLVVFSHSRQLWKNLPSHYKNVLTGKRNDVLIIGFAQYLKSAKLNHPLLALLEYGPDVENSKQLISQLKIGENVLWIPRMPKKKLMILLKHADIGADQFGNGFWGGTGREFFSVGKPLINYVRTSEEDYYKITGHKMPFLLRARTPGEICQHLLNVEKDKEYYIQTGKRNKDWFDRYGGIGLAKEYKRIIEDLFKEKRKRVRGKR